MFVQPSPLLNVITILALMDVINSVVVIHKKLCANNLILDVFGVQESVYLILKINVPYWVQTV